MECSLIWFSSCGLNCGLSLQVPYVPKFFGMYGGDDGARTRDLCLFRAENERVTAGHGLCLEFLKPQTLLRSFRRKYNEDYAG